jgi:hypothetical protein
VIRNGLKRASRITRRWESWKRKRPGIEPRLRIVRQATQRSVAMLIKEYRDNRWEVRRAALVVGSEIAPASIANPHIRAHALEGQLFRNALIDALDRHRVRAAIFTERDIYKTAAVRLKKSAAKVDDVVANLGRSVKPWRSEQKVAALAGWLALASH